MNLTPPLPSSNSDIENLTETIFNLRENMDRLESINKKLYAKKISKNKQPQKKQPQEKKIKKLERELQKFKKQLKEKDNTISSLKKELDEKNKKISVIENKLSEFFKTEDSDLEKIKKNFLEKYDIDMTYVDNLKILAHYRYSDNPRDEYSAYHSGELELSYDFIKDSDNIISVKYTADYNSSQSYENRFDPDVEFDSELNVSPNIKFDYDKDVEIYYTNPSEEDECESEEDNSLWCNLINKVLEEIDCNPDNFSGIVSDLTNGGEIIFKK